MSRLPSEPPDQKALRPVYLPDADAIFYLSEDVDCHELEIDDVLTVVLADDDARIVGAKIHGINSCIQVDNEPEPT